MTSPSSMHETGHSKTMHWDNPEGWDGMGRRWEECLGWGNTCTRDREHKIENYS